MRRSVRLLVLVVGLLAIGVGVAVWLTWFPPWSYALDKRLVGSWEGQGKVSGEVSINVNEGHGTTFSTNTTCTVWAEFKPDGTYRWVEQHRAAGFSAEFTLPDKGADPPRWETVRADWNKLTVRIHYGEVMFHFDGADSFTMELPESAKATGTLVFRRSD